MKKRWLGILGLALIAITVIAGGCAANQGAGNDLEACIFAYVFLDVPIDRDSIEKLDISYSFL